MIQKLSSNKSPGPWEIITASETYMYSDRTGCDRHMEDSMDQVRPYALQNTLFYLVGIRIRVCLETTPPSPVTLGWGFVDTTTRVQVRYGRVSRRLQASY